MALSFEKIKTVFRGQTDLDLHRAKWLFSAINYSFLMKVGGLFLPLLAKLPIAKQLIKQTLFKQFVGGETIVESTKTIDFLFNQFQIGSMLDYAVEG